MSDLAFSTLVPQQNESPNTTLQRIGVAIAQMVTQNAENLPYENAAVITPNDAVDLTDATRAISATGAGDLKVDVGGTPVIIAIGVGITRVVATRVYATGTDATGLVALW